MARVITNLSDVPSTNPEGSKTLHIKVPKQAASIPRATLLDPEVAGKVQTSFKKLYLAAADLNTASDELGKAVTIWDSALKKLNLGIEAWVDSSGGESGDLWWDRGIGYAQVNDKWGLALRTREGDYREPDQLTRESETWHFNQAPRWLRIEGVTKLPELLEALLRGAEDTTKELLEQTGQVLAMVDAVKASASMKEEG